MKKIKILLLSISVIVLYNFSSAQVCIPTISNLTVNNQNVAPGGTIKIPYGGSVNLQFSLTISKPKDLIVNGWIKSRYKSSSNSQAIIAESHSYLSNSSFSGSGSTQYYDTQLWVTLTSSMFSHTGGKYFVTLVSDLGVNYDGPSYPVEVGYPPIVNNTVTADQTVPTGSAPSLLNGSQPTGGSNTYTYQWQQKTDNSNWTNISGANQKNHQSLLLPVTTYIRRLVNSTDVVQSISNTVTITVLQTPLGNNIISGNQTIMSGSAPALLNGSQPTGGTDSYTYKWQESSDNITFYDIWGANQKNHQNLVLNSTSYIRRVVSSANVAQSISNTVKITVYPYLITNNTISGDQVIYSGTAPSLLNGSQPTGGTDSYTYQWQESFDNVTWYDIWGANQKNHQNLVVNSLVLIRRIVSSPNSTQSISNFVAIKVKYYSIANNTISADQTISAGSAPALLNGSQPTGGTGSYTYNWQQSSGNGMWYDIWGANQKNHQNLVLNSTTYIRRMITSPNSTFSVSNTVKITVVVYRISEVTEIAEQQSSTDILSLYPNPNNGQFTLSLNTTDNNELKITVVNVLGKEVYNQNQYFNKGENLLQIQLDKLPKGIYFVRVQNGNKQLQHKFIYQ
ncbi:MAG: T9SS type A sorting domain-containing protein [Bacteroidia bacterium]